MNCHFEYEQIYIKQEDDGLSTTELNSQLQSLKSEIKIESQEYDESIDNKPEYTGIKQEVLEDLSITATTKAELEKDLQDEVGKKEDVEEVESNFMHGAYNNAFRKKSCITVSDHEGENSQICTSFKNPDPENNIIITNLNTEIPKKFLNNHVKSKTQYRCDSAALKPLPCDKCEGTFNDVSSLLKHIKRKHGVLKQYTCVICNKFFNRKFYLNIHMATHSGTKPFMCEICNKYFYTKSHLDGHVKIHAGRPPVKCDMCNTTFSRKSNLKAHIAHKHKILKPVTCKICNKSFNWKSYLNRHMKLHTAAESFTCDTCNESFPFKLSLYNHIMRKHMGVRPFKCDICSKSFSRKYDHGRHMKILHF